MAQPFLLIDGYNLMHAAGMFQASFGPGEFEKRRNRFLSELAGALRAAERDRTTIVFDAPASGPHSVESRTAHGLRVIYARSELDADDVLEELIAAHSAPRQILLVSSDHRLQRAVKKRRGKFLDSEDFLARLAARDNAADDRTARQAPPQKYRGLQSATETESWLSVFGEVPEAGELRRRPPEIDLDALQREIDAEGGEES